MQTVIDSLYLNLTWQIKLPAVVWSDFAVWLFKEYEERISMKLMSWFYGNF